MTGTDLSSTLNPFTYAYEFGQSKTDLQTLLGTPIYGAAVPGAAETAATSQNILAYFPSGAGYTGYVTGGWTGIESGYPSAFGYISPTQQGSVYIAPNITFDFTEIQYEGKTVAQAEADWAAQFSAIGANAAGTPDRRLAHPRLRRRGVEHHDEFAHRTRPTPRRCTRTSSRRPTTPAMSS